MNIAFFVDPMNYRGIANSSFQYALYNEKILNNKSIIFHNKNLQNEKTVISKFKKKFKVIEITNFKEIDLYKDKLKLDFLYLQKGGEKDQTYSKKNQNTSSLCLSSKIISNSWIQIFRYI